MTIQKIRLLLVFGVAICFLVPSYLANAGLDSSRPILCAFTDAFDCDSTDGCEATQPESIGLPVLFELDLEKKEMLAAGGQETENKRATAIKSVTEGDGKLFLQGVEQSGWNLVVDKETGQMTLSASSGDEAILLFGRCTTP